MGAKQLPPSHQKKPKAKKYNHCSGCPSEQNFSVRSWPQETEGLNLRPVQAAKKVIAGNSTQKFSTSEELNSKLAWLSQFHVWDWIEATIPATNEKTKWFTEKRYPLDVDRLLDKLTDLDKLIGVRFAGGWDGKTRYFLLDVDFGSQYHPRQGEEAIQKLLSTLEEIGIHRHIKLRSSQSCGIHLYFPLPTAISTYWIGVTIQNKLLEAGFVIENGQLEIFPNVRSSGKTLFKGHRLPLQVGSFALDDDWHPVHDDLRRLIQTWNWAAAGQDLELLKDAIASTSKPFKKKMGKLPEWKADLEALMERGWTRPGQTNHIISKVLVYARVFLCLDWNTAEAWANEKIPTLDGFTKHSSHQKDYRRVVGDWKICHQKSDKYRPYTEFLKTAIRERKAPSNDEKQADAKKRIEKAAQALWQQGQLTGTVRHRQKLMRETAQCGIKTLWKYPELWHPNYEKPRCVTPQSEGNSAISAETEGKQIAAETLSESAVTHPALLSVPKLRGRDLTIQQREQEPPRGKLLSSEAVDDERSPVVQLSQNLEPQSPASQPLKPQVQIQPKPKIEHHSLVRRKADGANGSMFRVSQIETNGTAWLKWQGQLVPLVPFPCALTELELVT